MMLVVNLVLIGAGLSHVAASLNQYTLSQFMDAPYIGLGNYRGVLFDADNPGAWRACWARCATTALYSLLVTTVCSVAIGLAVALLLSRDAQQGRGASPPQSLPWVSTYLRRRRLWQGLHARSATKASSTTCWWTCCT